MYKVLSFIGIWSFSALLYAGAMGQVCEGEDVTMPCQETSWGIEAHALYVQASSDLIESQTNIQTNNGVLNYGSSPKWAWGFEVGGGFLWGSGSDFVWNWYDLRNTFRPRAVSLPVYLGTIIGNPNLADSILGQIEDLRIDSFDFNKTLEWDQINLEFGQNININANIHIRPHADLQIARLGSYLVSNVSGYNLTKGDFNYGQTWSNVYDGVGPRVGAYLNYVHDCGLSLYAQGAVGLLAGPSKASLQVIDELYQVKNIISHSSIRVVPNFDTKLGGSLNFEISQGILNIDIGWIWNAYDSPLTALISHDEKNPSNYSVQGLYFGLKWLGTMA